MRKIAICDTTHFEVSYTVISLFENTDTDITIFIHVDAYEQLVFLLGEKIKAFTWIIKHTGESNRSFINRMFRVIGNSSFDLIYLNTIEDNFIVYACHLQRLKVSKAILTVHDINGFFNYSPSFSLRRIIRYTGKRKLIGLLPAFNVLSDALVLHLESKLKKTKQVFNIPGGFFEPELYIKREYGQTEVIKISVPGSIDSRRRNYDVVFELLRSAQHLNIDISVTLLGSFSKKYGRAIQRQCIEYCKHNKNLHIYTDETVPQSEFDAVMQQSHFIWIPLRPFVVINDGIQEQYGTSICSGNLGDVIRHARPFFTPSALKVDMALAECRLSYNQVSEIIKILQSLTYEEYKEMQEKSWIASMYYTKEKIIHRNASLFL